MGLYAAIASGYVRSLITSDTTPTVPSNADSVVDVTSMGTAPTVGYKYNGGLSFSFPAPLMVPTMIQEALDLMGNVQGAYVYNVDEGYFKKNDGGGWNTDN